MNDPVINGNILTVFAKDMMNICSFVLQNAIEVYSVMPADEGFQMSTPITKDLEANIPGILHGARARLKAAEKPKPKPPTGGGNPDGTPPNGGTPGTPTLSLPDTWVLPSAVAA